MNALIAMNRMRSQRGIQKGVALLEVLIVFFVLSVGLLGMAALQMKSIQYNQSAYIRSQANVAVYDILDRMRLNRAVAISSGYNMASLGATSVSGGTLATADAVAWAAFLSNTLPGGLGQVICAATMCTITIEWTDRVSGNTAQLIVAAQI